MADLAQHITLVIPSTDRYADVWMPTLQALERYWRARPFRTVLVANGTAGIVGDVDTINVREDLGWSSTLLAALGHIATEYVLLWIDDLVLLDHVDNGRFAALSTWAIERRIDYLRYNPLPSSGGFFDAKLGIREVPPGALYRASTVCSLWRSKVLRALLDPSETAWEFELKGSYRSDRYALFFASATPVFRFANLVVKGSVDPRAASRIRKAGLEIPSSSRPVMDDSRVVQLRLRELRTRVLGWLPWQWQRPLRRLLHPDRV